MTKAEATRDEWLAQFENAPARKSAPGVSTVETIRSMTGLEFIRAIAEGRLPHPPMGDAINFCFLEAVKGHVTMLGHALPAHYNPIGSVHGGWACTLLDSCMACSVQTTLAAGQGYTTVELKVNLVRPISSETGPLRAEGRVINAGRTIATAEGRLVGADGKLYAHGTTTCLILGL
ncbi:MAG: PaaI family thioesterase [Burkholderiales bacterium]|nr:PaaI family thioesterase [Burkholderiales bacterium]